MLILVDIFEEDRVDSSKNKNVKKSGNRLIKILAKLKNRKLLMFRSKNLFKSKNLTQVQIISSIKKLNFLIPNAKAVFIELRQIFI